MFREFPIVNESVFADSDVLGYYIKNDLEGKIPSKYQELQNRINIDKDPDYEGEVGEYLKIKQIFILLLFLILN